MIRASLCSSSGEQRPCYCIWCVFLVLLDVVGSGCGALSCRLWALYVKEIWGFVACSAVNFTSPYFALPYFLQRFGRVKLFGRVLIGLSLRNTYSKPGHFIVDKKNQLDVTFGILYFSSNSRSTCFGQACAHHQELTTAWFYSLVLVCAVAAGRLSRPVGR